MTEIVLIAHNIRSIHNLGSIFRTAEGFGVRKIYLSGYTPSPDHGLPHVRTKITGQLHKTALGAEELIEFSHHDDINALLDTLKKSGCYLIGLEQDPRAIPLPEFVIARSAATKQSSNINKPGSPRYARDDKTKIALLLGEEVHGITPDLRDQCDVLVEIPMLGTKESFNVAVATGITLYHFTTTASAP